jgi:hypothetical protein
MIMIKTLLDVLTMSVVDLTGWLKEVEEVFKEASMSLQQHGKLYLTEEEWEARRKKHKAENHSGIGARGNGAGKGRGHGRGHRCGSSSSSGSSSMPTGDECRCCGKMGHWARECRSKHKKEQVYVAQNEEEALLMIVTTTQIHSEAGRTEAGSPIAPAREV